MTGLGSSAATLAARGRQAWQRAARRPGILGGPGAGRTEAPPSHPVAPLDGADFDVIVVGAGIAGSVTARQLALAGRSVLLVERGESPGAKNLSGGVLYTHALRDVLPDLAAQAPVERVITRNQLRLVTADADVAVDASDARLADPVNAVSVLRARFDPWLAEQAEQAGAFLMTGVRIDELLREDGPNGARVVGVRSGEEQLRASVVVAADGANSFLAQSVGLRPPAPTHHLGLGVKGVLAMDRAAIEDRFAVTGDEGAALALVGDCTGGIDGGAFVYTNRESLSVGVVLRLDALVASGRSATDLFEHFLGHRSVAPLLRGGRLLEYGAHLVPEGGLEMLGRLAMDGLVVVGDAAGMCLNTGLTLRGMDLAAGAAVAAAAGIEHALDSGDVSATGLDGYRRALFDGFVGHDLRTYAGAPGFLANPRLYDDYGRLATGILHEVFRHDGSPRRPLAATAGSVRRAAGVSLPDLARDAWRGVRAL